MKTLTLFNGVVAKKPTSPDVKPYVSELGFIIEPNALWAKDAIINFYTQAQLDGKDLNKTFHKSWKKIQESSRLALLVEQITHYISTYGSDFQDEVYIPNEVLDIPEIKLTYKVIKGYTKEEVIQKCLAFLQSGIALQEETINDIITILVDELSYTFTGNEGVKNREALVKIADMYGVLPTDLMEFFRYIIYRATGQSLIIKSSYVIEAIKESNFNPAVQFRAFGLEQLASIFNRFKPLFLAFKQQCPTTINKIARLSKKHHKPLVSNPLNRVTSQLLTKEDKHWLDNATPYALCKALQICYQRTQGQSAFLYRIRNGTSWVRDFQAQDVKKESEVCTKNFHTLMGYMQKKYNLKGKTCYFPEDVVYAIPTSEKMFIGNIPGGTKFFAEHMAVGIYWQNEWGARDLDLSGINIGGKVGWNSTYSQDKGHLMYSGDITNAPNGAVEYLYAQKGLTMPTLIKNNVYSGSAQCQYKIIIGKGDKISEKYMMNPNNLFAEILCNSVQRQTILGLLVPEEQGQSFVLLNVGAGQLQVSRDAELSNLAVKALYQQWERPYTFASLVTLLGAEIVETPEEAHYNFSLDTLQKDSFMQVFSA